MSPRCFSLVRAAVAAFVFLSGCNSVLGFQEGKPYPPDAAVDASVDSDGSVHDGPTGAEGGCPTDPTGCKPADACHIGKVTCNEAGSKCEDTGAVQSDGTPCGSGMVCSSGACVSCPDSLTCSVPGKPCREAKISCSTGKAICTETGNVAQGTECGSKMICSNGDCVMCSDGASCVPDNPCHTGKQTCGDSPKCVDQTTDVADGTMCGVDKVCSKGNCMACKAGATCPVSNPCRTGTLACNTGSPVCVDLGNMPNGTMCGTGQVCKDGACVACADGQSCTPTNACSKGALVCSGAPTCKDTGVPVNAGTPCGTDKVCSAGMCVDCPDGRACTPAGTQCKVGTTSCSTGASVCGVTGNAPNGSSCGSNMVCSAGSCIACTDGATCTPTNPCHAGKLSCTGGTPTCMDMGSAIANGTSCGADLVCSNGACVTCAANATCVPNGNICKTGSTSCGTGTSVCSATGNASNGMNCGTNQVCSNGSCIACQAGTICTPSNPCHAGTLSCSGGTPTCVDTGNALSNGANCGTNLVCSNGSCMSCTGGASCPISGMPCKAGTISCVTGTPVCNVTGNIPDMTSCGSGQVCYQGACKTPNCSGANTCGSSDMAGGTCTDARGTCSTPGFRCVGTQCTCDATLCSMVQAPPNTKSVCSGNACVFQCLGSNPPLSCSTSTNPACGRWDFESNSKENWFISPDSPSSTVSLFSLSASTQQTSAGSYSLAVHKDPSQFGAGVRIRVPLCPAGALTSLMGRKIHFRVMVQTAPGFPPFDAGSGEKASADPSGWNGSTLSYIPNEDRSLLPEGSWVAFDVPSLQDPTVNSLTDFGITLGVDVLGTWSGTFYVDDVQLQ